MNNNYENQQIFLDKIKRISMLYPNMDIDYKLIYKELINFGIRDYNGFGVDISNTFPIFQEYFKNQENLRVFTYSGKEFLYFSNGNLSGNEIKLYIPLDINHIKEGVKEIFTFISQNNISHQSKVAKKIRSDDLVVRVNTKEDAFKIINFVRSNYYLKEGLLKTNPFLPNCEGVGMTMDNNTSYNQTVSKIISDYFNILKERDRLDLFTVDNLNTYIKEISSNIEDLDLKDIYNLVGKITRKDYTFKDFIDHVDNKLLDKYRNRERITDPSYYLEEAIKNTKRKHPELVMEDGLKAYLKGNPKGFTRDNNSRSSIIKHVAPSDLISLMRYKLSDNNISIPRSDNDLINIYLQILKKEDMINDFDVIKNAYINTFDSYGYKQANYALGMLITDKDVRYFTNKFKDRNNLKQIVDKDIKEIIISNIGDDGININNIDDIVNKFSHTVFEDESRTR